MEPSNSIQLNSTQLNEHEQDMNECEATKSSDTRFKTIWILYCVGSILVVSDIWKNCVCARSLCALYIITRFES